MCKDELKVLLKKLFSKKKCLLTSSEKFYSYKNESWILSKQFLLFFCVFERPQKRVIWSENFL